MRELNLEEVEAVVGGDCYYAGANYSVGSVISNPAGGYLECSSSPSGDYWSRYM